MKMYRELAPWWPLLSAPSHYAEEAREIARLIRRYAKRRVHEVLELGSGGGNNASHLKRRFEMTLVEPSPGMRQVSRALNPECQHRPGDMRTVRLRRTFDAVLIHDAVMYMTTARSLHAAVRTASVHLRPGGVALFAPDATRETFRAGVRHGGGDEGRARAKRRHRSLRYLEWTLDPDPASPSQYSVHYALLLRGRNSAVRVVHDHHREGLFSRATWLEMLQREGLHGRVDRRVVEGASRDVIVARKPSDSARGRSEPLSEKG